MTEASRKHARPSRVVAVKRYGQNQVAQLAVGEESLHRFIGRAGASFYEHSHFLQTPAEGRADFRHIGDRQGMNLKHQNVAIRDQRGIGSSHRGQNSVRCLVGAFVGTVGERRLNQFKVLLRAATKSSSFFENSLRTYAGEIFACFATAAIGVPR